ncbi:MAG: hypothetical protein QOJ24_1109 [Mycobacterium sp.]|nr:hypothetical protein [Mycobacterium sp.]
MTVVPGPVRQMGYVVADLDQQAALCTAAVIEISKLSEAAAANAVVIHDAAAERYGTSPVRNLPG